jgi:hypothetical protein
LAPSSINQRLSAIRKLALEAADNGLMAPELAAGISRVKGAKRLGVRTGNWLNKEQAEALINSPDTSTLKGKRDRGRFGADPTESWPRFHHNDGALPGSPAGPYGRALRPPGAEVGRGLIGHAGLGHASQRTVAASGARSRLPTA